MGRVGSLAHTLPAPGAANSTSWTFGYNPASQITQLTRSNDAYAFTGSVNLDRAYTTNGLNQYTVAGPAAFCYDPNGNLTADGSSVFLYDPENRLVEKRAQTNSSCSALSYAGALQASLRYDPLGRLHEVASGAATTRFLHDGDALVAEYDGAGTLLRRHVHGADLKSDDPIAWYEGASFTAATERFLRSDWQGSIVLVTDTTGAGLIALNAYDEYGIPQAANQGRFQYTGQAWLAEIGMYYYKARIYSPTLGRFMQTDPIGYGDGLNWYNYVGSDPVNKVDPSGMMYFIPITTCTGGEPSPDMTDTSGIVVNARVCSTYYQAVGEFGFNWRSERTRSGGGGGGGGGKPQRRQSKGLKRVPCSSLENEPGKVAAVFGDVIGINGLGAGVQGGVVRNLSTGSVAIFASPGAGLGGEAAVGAGVSVYSSMSNFVGTAFSLNAAGFGMQGSLVFSKDGSLIGGAIGGAVGEGGSATVSHTFLLYCFVRGG